MIVTKQDVLAAGLCGPGMGEWCRLHGFSSTDIQNGVPEEALLATGCALAERVVRAAHRRAAAQREE